MRIKNHPLHDIALFSQLSRGELDRIALVATEIRMPAGTVLMSQGAIGKEMVFVLDGVLEVSRDDRYVADICAGSFAGEAALLTDTPRNSTVTTKTDTRLLHIDGRGFSSLCRDIPQFNNMLVPVAAERFAATAN
jgi:CRP-like cAMP-binding protein